MRFPSSRSASNSGRRSIAARRFAGKPTRMLSRARCRIGLLSAFFAFALKAGLVMSMSPLPLLRRLRRLRPPDRRPLVGHVGEHLGDVADAHVQPLPRQLAGHVEEAAHVAGEEGVGTGAYYVGRLVGD